VTSPTQQLLELLDLEMLGGDRFRSRPPEADRPRLYGGHLLGQATMAAGRVVGDDRPVHSTHAYFLSSGVATEPIEYEVTTLRESGSFTICTVRAEQRDRTLLQMTASFHVDEAGPVLDRAMPSVPPPEGMIEVNDWLLAQPEAEAQKHLPFISDFAEFRQAPESVVIDEATGRGSLPHPQRDIWVRVTEPLPDSRMLHASVIAYLSDKPALGTTVLGPPLHGSSLGFQVASLDHSMWFHRDCRADEWLLFRCDTATTGGARAFARIEVYAGGVLAVSVTQEGLIRPARPRP
jgi:acyl-CoA thioesterase-2